MSEKIATREAFGKAIVFVGLAEGVAIFALLVVIFIKFL